MRTKLISLLREAFRYPLDLESGLFYRHEYIYRVSCSIALDAMEPEGYSQQSHSQKRLVRFMLEMEEIRGFLVGEKIELLRKQDT